MQCEPFTYGGCLGNHNNFQSDEKCMSYCGLRQSRSTAEDCRLPSENGQCRGNYLRWFYDPDIRNRRTLRYDGCQGNRNNFATEHECLATCLNEVIPVTARPLPLTLAPTPAARDEDMCTLPLVQPCDNEARVADCGTFFYYNAASGECVEVPDGTCNNNSNNFYTSDQCEAFCNRDSKRYAETWDYHVTPSTFLQFDIAMGCDSLYDTLYGVMLEYSTNMGRDWQTVTSECAPPSYECDGYHLKSDYMSDQHQNWTRISVNLPQGAVSPATRFRWQQHSQTPSGNIWALDNVYLGDGCPWLCSGHGYCNKGTCVCDDGYAGEYCVASRPLPMMLRDDFIRDKPKTDNWLEVYNAETSNICGTLISGNALTFSGDQLRMAVTRDLDTTMLTSVEFYFLFGCNGSKMEWPRKDSVLLQFSTNGGITWKLLKELHYRNDTIARFFSIELPMDARYNSTRLRFWQPHRPGKMLSTWAVDNLFIGRMVMNPSSMSDNFESGTSDTSWLFVNDGELDSYCEQNTRSDSMGAGQTALVFRQVHDIREHSVITRDLNVGPMSVLHFDINVGCSSESTHKYPVHLEYSSDGGKT
ncbi:reelin-like isoform X1 [Dreissena polymorpha]|uniref:reelin-like isoform X1 n=1 Tax=Dreissena polymorpha TaxID=45954 RepID=UPI00226469AF|nr:reelin-like isoform X1 [Dreissena polymorpha]